MIVAWTATDAEKAASRYLQSRLNIAVWRALSFVLIVCCIAPAAGAASSLEMPFVKVRTPDSNDGRKTCDRKIPTPVLELDLLSIYDQDDKSRSTVDPKRKKVYDAAIGNVRNFVEDVTKFASNYVQTDGNRLEDAACVFAYLDRWAKADAMSVLKTRQSALSSTRIVAGTALAYMQVRGAAPRIGVDTAEIDKWLDRRAAAIIPVYTESGDVGSNRQNHRYWGGLAVAAVGVAIGKKEYLQFGVDSYTIGACQIEADGSLPLELARKKKARDYHLHATAPLVMIAELATANAIDAYAMCDGAIHRLVDFDLRAVENPQQIETLTGSKMLPLPIKKGFLRGDRFAWVDAYFARFPDLKENYKIKLQRPLYSSNIGGRVTVMYDVGYRN
jgi:poly(beta-D-mannuronate) lyase